MHARDAEQEQLAVGSANVFGGGGLLSFYNPSGQRVREAKVDSPVTALVSFASGTEGFRLCPALLPATW